ncbi:MAG: electron transport complex subunit RsxC [Bacteroidales bacterium]|nr:electron transport complex subunit RsxC [Bacteroidales bacterium]
MKKYTFRMGGIHPPQHKSTADSPIQQGPVAPLLTLLLSQSIGAPSKPLVKPGDKVVAGQPVAEPGGFVSSWIHSPCCGTVKKLERVRTPQGYPVDAITIERDPEGTESFSFPPLDPSTASSEELVQRVREAGIVGLGGATFPTFIKLTPPPGTKPECVILNGAECEPYLTCDDRLMREHAAEIAEGAYCLMRSVGVRYCYIGIEANKPEAIAAMKQAAEKYQGMKVCVLRTKYPQGGEKQLIAAIMGREVPSGALPVAVGAIVDNVATAYAVQQAVVLGKPLTGRVLTVTGEGALNPGNYYVELGTPLTMIMQADERVNKVIGGGPMMGKAMSNLDTPSTKGLSGVLTMCLDSTPDIQPCIRCAACYSACPMGLEPMLLARQAENGDWEYAAQSGVMDCIECGSCAYTCPSNRRLLDWIRYSKTQVRKLK